MNTNKTSLKHRESKLRFVLALSLVFIISFSSFSSFSILAEMDIDKIEKLVEGESDIDFEEKEKNLESEEDPFISSNFNKYYSNLDRATNSQNWMQISIYQSKIPTPPPDLV